MIRRIPVLAIIILVLCISKRSEAQHEQQYTQFMYNKLAINPGYVGSYDGITATALYRQQWIGLEGAPRTMGLTLDAAVKSDKIGIGANIFRHTIGIYDTWTVDGMYAYKLKMGPKSTLSAGLQGSLRYYGLNFLDPRLKGAQGIGIDPSIPQEEIGNYILNFGFGLYFSSEHFFAGLSIPRLLNSNLDFVERDIPLSRESRHAFAMIGGVIPLNESLDLIPQMLIKQVQNAPISADFNAGLMLDKRYTLAFTYRTGGLSTDFGSSVDVIVGIQISNPLFFGVSYDILLSSLRNYSTGSFEAVLRYRFDTSKDQETPVRVINPRYF
jgi:type IX secretion system PorP/SprF family membrane protein